MSVQGELYRSYDSYVDGRMYMSTGSEGSVMQHQAQQFVQSFGGYGVHAQQQQAQHFKQGQQHQQRNHQQPPGPRPPRGCGIGLRVEKNAAGELFVAAVNENGSADRDGTIRVGDLLGTVDGVNVENFSLMQLRPLFMGAKGTYVRLGMKRWVNLADDDPVDKRDLATFQLELVRGDPMFFLGGENKALSAKAQQLKKQVVEAELELDGLRGVLKQAEGRSKLTQKEMDAIQNRYKNIQQVIERCNTQITEEKRIQVVQTKELEAPLATSERNKSEVKMLHESLTRIEVQLSQVMSDLEDEQRISWELKEQADKERRLTEMVNEKIKMHSTYTSEAYAAEEATRSECVKAQAQCVAAIEQLRKQLDETKAQSRSERQQSAEWARRAEEEEEKLAEVQNENQRTHMKLQMVEQVLSALRDEDKRRVEAIRGLSMTAEQGRSQAEGGEEAVSHEQRMLDHNLQRWTKSYAQVQEDRLLLKDAAEKRSADLRVKITSMGEANLSMQGQARDVLIRMENKEQDMQAHNLELSARLEAKKRETSRMQDLVNSTGEKLNGTKRDVQSLAEESRALHKGSQKILEEADAARSRADEAEHDISEGLRRKNVRSEFAESRIAEGRVRMQGVEEEVAAARREGEAAERETRAAKEEIARCREAIAKLGQHQQNLRLRQDKFYQMHLRSTLRARDTLMTARSNSHAALSSLGVGIDPEAVFLPAREAAAAVHAGLRNLEMIKGSVYQRRQAESTRNAAESAAAAVALGPSYRAQELISMSSSLPGPAPTSLPQREAHNISSVAAGRGYPYDGGVRGEWDLVRGSTMGGGGGGGGGYTEELLRRMEGGGSDRNSPQKTSNNTRYSSMPSSPRGHGSHGGGAYVRGGSAGPSSPRRQEITFTKVVSSPVQYSSYKGKLRDPEAQAVGYATAEPIRYNSMRDEPRRDIAAAPIARSVSPPRSRPSPSDGSSTPPRDSQSPTILRFRQETQTLLSNEPPAASWGLSPRRGDLKSTQPEEVDSNKSRRISSSSLM